MAPGFREDQDEREKVEKLIVECLEGLEGDYKGEYYELANIQDSELTDQEKEDFVFQKGNRFHEAAGFNRNWPNNRGVYISE